MRDHKCVHYSFKLEAFSGREVGGMAGSLLSEEDIQKLNRDIRILIATNGTLTRILKVIKGEEIAVDIITQQLHSSLPDDFGFAKLPIGQILQRQVVLKGCDSGKPFVIAESLISVDHLPPSIMTRLVGSNCPMGEIMAASRLETFKEAAEVWIGDLPDWAWRFGCQNQRSSTIARRYQIINEGRGLIFLSEYFLQDSLKLSV